MLIRNRPGVDSNWPYCHRSLRCLVNLSSSPGDFVDIGLIGVEVVSIKYSLSKVAVQERLFLKVNVLCID